MTPIKKTKTPTGRARSFKVELRHERLVKFILENPLEITAKGAAKAMKVSISTAKRDMRDPDVQAYLKEALQAFANEELTQAAVGNIKRGITTRGDEDLSKWILEKTHFFPPDRLAIEGETAADRYFGKINAALQEDAGSKGKNGGTVDINELISIDIKVSAN